MLKTNSKKAINNIWAYIMEDLDYINSGYGYEITEGDRKATAAAIAGYFEENGRRYGLLKEFRENAIC